MPNSPEVQSGIETFNSTEGHEQRLAGAALLGDMLASANPDVDWPSNDET